MRRHFHRRAHGQTFLDVQHIRDEIRRNDVEGVKRELGALREEAQQLKSDVREKATAADVAVLSREVAYLKEKSGEGGPDELGMHHEPLPYDRQNPLNGIIAHLTRECRGNVYTRDVVDIITRHGVCEPASAFDLGTDTWYVSDDVYAWCVSDDVGSGGMVCYDFKDRRVSLTSYTMRTAYDYFPKSWVLEVSNNSDLLGSWTVIDRRADNEDLKGKPGEYVTHSFAVNSPAVGRSFRFVRFRLTGETHDGFGILAFTALELFGRLDSPLKS